MGRRIGKLGDYVLYAGGLKKEEISDEENAEMPEMPYGTFNFTYGPSAGGLIESIGFDILTNGEYIVAVKPRLYKCRKVHVTGLNINDAVFAVQRINAAFSASHATAFLLASSKEIDYYMKIDLILKMELERIRNNLHVIGRMVDASSQGVASNWIFYLRELVNRSIDRAYGHRFFFNSNVNKYDGLGKELKSINKEFIKALDGLLGTRIFIDRLEKNGTISSDDLIGPAARAAGYDYDARNEVDLPYKDLGFRSKTDLFKAEGRGDALDRFLIRASEIPTSTELVERALDLIGKRGFPNPSVHNDVGIGRVESPSGDLAYYVRINDKKVQEIYLLSPSDRNLAFFARSMAGNIFTDFQFNWESFGVWASELGVSFT
jgi:Ni,Fe-hydrogenase III large subunit